MKSILVFFALATLCQGVPFERTFGGRIIDGEDAEVGEIPFQVSLQSTTNVHFCGGSIINKYWVITAAHCVEGMRANWMKVYAGTIRLNDPKSIHKVVELIIHAGYAPSNSWKNDIALLKVEKPFVISKTTSYAILPERNARVSAGSVAVTSGWGSTVAGGRTPNRLQRTNILIADQEFCNRVNSAEDLPVHNTQICAFHPRRKTGSCHGDSGGPLTVNGKLVGLTSWGLGCASRELPTVYTRVSQYIDWIKAHAI